MSFPTFAPGRLSFAATFWIAVVPDGNPPTALPRDMKDAPPASVPWIGAFEARRRVDIVPPRQAAPPPATK